MIGTLMAKSKIRSGFNALNQRDIDTFLAGWKDDATWTYPGNLSISGEFKGKKAIEEWFRKFLEQFPQIKFNVKHIDVQNIFDMIGTNYVAVEWDIDLKNRDGKEFHNSGVTAIDIKMGKAIRGRDYISDLETTRKAWGEG